MANVGTILIILSLQIVSTKAMIPSNRFNPLPNCKKDKALDGFTFQTVTVKSKIQCTDLCAQIQSCSSVNVKKSDSKKFVCELNEHHFLQNCSHLIDMKGSSFYQKMAPASCKDLRNKNPAASTGVYFIQPMESAEPFKAYCEMDTAGGGWTLVYSYRFLDLHVGMGPARLSVWPTWDREGETPKSSVVPLSNLDEGAMEFDLWKEIGEEFLITSSVTNWYACAPAATNGGSLTGWRDGDLDCSVAKVEINGTGCDDVVPMRIAFDHLGLDPVLLSDKGGNQITVLYDGQRDKSYPTHDPCGEENLGKEQQRSDDPRGAICLR